MRKTMTAIGSRTKKCSHCQETKHETAFKRDARKPSGYGQPCNDCESERKAQKRQKAASDAQRGLDEAKGGASFKGDARKAAEEMATAVDALTSTRFDLPNRCKIEKLCGDEERPSIANPYLDASDPGGIYIVATNGHAAIAREVVGAGNVSGIIPKALLGVVRKGAKDVAGDGGFDVPRESGPVAECVVRERRFEGRGNDGLPVTAETDAVEFPAWRTLFELQTGTRARIALNPALLADLAEAAGGRPGCAVVLEFGVEKNLLGEFIAKPAPVAVTVTGAGEHMALIMPCETT